MVRVLEAQSLTRCQDCLARALSSKTQVYCLVELCFFSRVPLNGGC